MQWFSVNGFDALDFMIFFNTTFLPGQCLCDNAAAAGLRHELAWILMF